MSWSAVFPGTNLCSLPTVIHSISYTLYEFSLLVNIPIEGIRLLDAVCLLLGKRRCVPFAAVWSQPGVVCSEKVTFDPLTSWPFQKRTPQGQFRGPPTYTHQVWRRSVKGPRRSRGTNKQTDKTLLELQYDKTTMYHQIISSVILRYLFMFSSLCATADLFDSESRIWPVRWPTSYYTLYSFTEVSEMFPGTNLCAQPR